MQRSETRAAPRDWTRGVQEGLERHLGHVSRGVLVHPVEENTVILMTQHFRDFEEKGVGMEGAFLETLLSSVARRMDWQGQGWWQGPHSWGLT